MRRLLSSICASMLAASFAVSGVAQVNAAPMFVPAGPAAGSMAPGVNPDIRYVRNEWGMRGGGGGWHRGGGWNRGNWRGGGWNRGWSGAAWGGRDMPYYNRWAGRGWRGGAYHNGWRGRNWGYHNGYRGYSYYQPGYRYYNDFWFPAAAFITGALITGAIANSQPRYYRGGGSGHEQWCYNRYRSYRAWDNTFQPYNGPRRQCYSPYN